MIRRALKTTPERRLALTLYGAEILRLSDKYGIEPSSVAPRSLTGPLRGLQKRNAAARAAGYTYFFSGPVEQHPRCQTGNELWAVNEAQGECLECRKITEAQGDAQ
jgi:hypothetical protein